MDKIKSLSQAVRYGATLRPQGFGALIRHRDGEWKTCAVGAALEAISPPKEVACDGRFVPVLLPEQALVERFPNAARYVKCPFDKQQQQTKYYRGFDEELAATVGVTRHTINGIRQNRLWTHIPRTTKSQ